jgi:O-antigen ligase
VSVPVALGAASVGVLLTQHNPKATAVLALLALCAIVVVSLEVPILAFGALACILALASEEHVDDGLLGISTTIYGTTEHGISISLVLVAVLALALGARKSVGYPKWPGACVTVLVCLLAVATVSALLVGPIRDNLLIVRPLLILLLASLGGYWISQEYGVDLPLKILVAAAGVAIIPGLYNSFSTGDLSYYDSSYIFLIGMAATLVLFRAVDIGFARIPFVLLSALVIVLSFRRGAMLAVAIVLVVTGLVSGRAGSRVSIWVIGASVLAIELVSPGLVYNHLEDLVTYFTGSTGQDSSINYRKYETVNAWMNVKNHWVWGIGPTTDWIVYRTFDGKFAALGPDYLHNSYLWVWLRYSLFGLILYLAFLATPAILLIRRSAPIVTLAVGASMLGLAVALVTASSLTTTTRWPLIVGFFLGIALTARAQSRATESQL